MSKKDPRSPRDILKEPYARILIPEDDGTYFAQMLEFSGCYAQGDTPEEAVKNLESAAESWIEAALEQGQDIPAPMEVYGYSGKLNLRLPRSIHKRAAAFAAKDDVSLNHFLACAIAARVGAYEFYEHLVEKLRSQLLPSGSSEVTNLPRSATNPPAVEAAEVSPAASPPRPRRSIIRRAQGG